MGRPGPELAGVFYALAAYGTWGLVPIYWKAVAFVPGLEMVAHRTVWAVPLLALWLGPRRRLGQLFGVLGRAASRRRLCLTALLLACNWLVFIWAVTAGHLVEASLGYFLNPLVNVLLGRVVLGEQLTRRQGLAVGLALAGVAWMGFAGGAVPWIALVLAGTFGLYGLLRKQAGVDALLGLGSEVLILFLPALGYLLATGVSEGLAIGGRGVGPALLVAASGFLTVLPLVWFNEAARRLRYSTLGFFQYLAPTGQFLLGVLVYGEAFSGDRVLAFALIWAAVILYLGDAARGPRIIAGSPVSAVRPAPFEGSASPAPAGQAGPGAQASGP